MDRLRYFGFLLKDISRLHSKNFERHSVTLTLTLTLAQCKVLPHLQRNEGVSQVRLAELADTDPMTLVRFLDRMERDGWVERHAYLTENPLIPDVLVKLDNHGLPGDQIGQVFLGLSPECLAPFRSVNTLQPDLVLGLAGIDGHDGRRGS
jgi:MarR family